MAFGLDFFTVAPGLRLAGDSVAFAYKFTGKGGQLKGLQGLEIGLVDDPTVKLLEGSVTGYEQVADRDVAYDALIAGGLTEIVPGLALGIDSLSSIETGGGSVRLAVAGHQPTLVFRNATVQEVTKVGDGGYTWDLPAGAFTTLKAAADAYQSDLKTKVEQMIADRVAADGVLQTIISDQATSDATARGVIETNLATEIADRIAAITAEEQRVDALIASGMWLFATQGDFPAAADNHGRVVHSHADGAIFFAHGGAWHQVAKEVDLQSTISSLASEASTREAADTTLQGNIDAEAATRATADTTEATARAGADAALSARLDTLEADPTTATAVAAGDAATLSSANSYTDTAVSNVIGSAPGVLDTLGEIADAINDDANVYTTLVSQISAVQSDVDGNEADSDAAEAALSGRLDTLEADPTTATAVAAVQADVNQNESDSDAADAALSARLDVLEADPTTATAVAAVQSDVDQNEADSDAAIASEATTRGNADTALSGRLDVLEADPTTATAVAAVQADVDQNESDADAADAALSGRLDVLEADPTTATAVAAVQADVDQNEADADAALALKAPLADPDFTGQLEVDVNLRLEYDSNLTKIHNVLRGTSIEIGNNIQMKPAAAGGRVEVAGGFQIDITEVPEYSNDTQAAAGGVIVGGIYRSGSVLHIRVS